MAAAVVDDPIQSALYLEMSRTHGLAPRPTGTQVKVHKWTHLFLGWREILSTWCVASADWIGPFHHFHAQLFLLITADLCAHGDTTMMIHRVAGKSPSRWWLAYQGFDSYGACSQGMSLLENLQGYIRFLAPPSVGVLQILQSILVILVFIWLVTTVQRRLGPRQETWTASTGPVLEIWRWSSPNRLMHLQSLGVCDPMVLSLKPLFNLSKVQPLCSQQVGPLARHDFGASRFLAQRMKQVMYTAVLWKVRQSSAGDISGDWAFCYSRLLVIFREGSHKCAIYSPGPRVPLWKQRLQPSSVAGIRESRPKTSLSLSLYTYDSYVLYIYRIHAHYVYCISDMI